MTRHTSCLLYLLVAIVGCSSASDITLKHLPQKTAPADALEDFGNEMSYFYLAPTEEGFSEFQKRAEDFRGELQGAGNDADIIVVVMIARISATYNWPISDSPFGVRAREILDGRSQFARYISDDSAVNPTKLDVWWASFFATGDDRFLENILEYAGLELPEDDIGRMLVIGAATWSFKANCRQHKRVLTFAEQKLSSPSIAEPQTTFLQECIDFAEAESVGRK